jgi:acyl-CoA thioester hydrolase
MVSLFPEAVVNTTPEFFWTVRVYYEDTDAAGVVYHSNYLKFMERARTEWLRSAGYSQAVLEQQEGIVFVVAKMAIAFLSPACFDENLNVHSTITTMDGARLVFEQAIHNESGAINCKAQVDIVCVDSKSFKPKRIPNSIKAKLIHDV